MTECVPLRALLFARAHAAQSGEAELNDEQTAAVFIRSGDAEAFRLLVERYQERVFRLAVSVLSREFAAEAEEVAQDVFLEVYRNARRFRGEARFSTWLYRIALNRALDVRERARYRRPHVTNDAAFAAAASKQDPASEFSRRETALRLEREIEALPELQQAVLRLHYWFEEPIEEIAARLGMPVNTVKSHLLRARRRLAAQLGEGSE